MFMSKTPILSLVSRLLALECLQVYPHAIKVFLPPFYPLSTFGGAHMTKNTRLLVPAQLQCLCSGAWEPGNEAN